MEFAESENLLLLRMKISAVKNINIVTYLFHSLKISCKKIKNSHINMLQKYLPFITTF
jgi:hypothetical protein